MSNSLWSHGLWPSRLLCPWDLPRKSTGTGCHSLFQDGSHRSSHKLSNRIIWNHAVLIGTEKIIGSLVDRPNEIFLRVSLKQLWALLRIRGKLYSYFDSTDKKEITFILTLALIKGKIASWVGGDEPINDSEKRQMPSERLWSSDLLQPWLLELLYSSGSCCFPRAGKTQSTDPTSLSTQWGEERGMQPAPWHPDILQWS